jgi:hypothetical protein
LKPAAQQAVFVARLAAQFAQALAEMGKLLEGVGHRGNRTKSGQADFNPGAQR